MLATDVPYLIARDTSYLITHLSSVHNSLVYTIHYTILYEDRAGGGGPPAVMKNRNLFEISHWECIIGDHRVV